MGEVIAKVEVVPEGLDIDLEALKIDSEAIVKEFGDLVGTEVKPMAFGMKALIFTVILKELAGGADPLERALGEQEGVTRAEAVDVRRLM
jgi:elongation factor 1-beta